MRTIQICWFFSMKKRKRKKEKIPIFVVFFIWKNEEEYELSEEIRGGIREGIEKGVRKKEFICCICCCFKVAVVPLVLLVL